MSTTTPPLTPHLHASGRSRLVAYDFGAHLAEWSVDGVSRVWLSREAVLDGSSPVRGGVPICFPWFAGGPDGDLSPSHGLVRTAVWRPVPAEHDEVWAWEISSDDVAGAPGAEHVPGPFRARYAVSLRGAEGAEELHLALRVTNTGHRDYRAEAALHTYLAVEDVRQVQILGLEGAAYLDKVSGRREVQDGPIRLDGETDRIYDRAGPVVVDDRAALGHHEVRPVGAAQTVVWNPWDRKAADLPDLGDDEWLRFVCVETAARGEHALALAAGDTVEIAATLSHHHSPAS
ncbi:D-hexose-6-phosphate mutarotase [Ornithinimicrobium pekingense]|uniref:Putative glucose-6-phosphate 1-epimerase n=1 Tax=Ornithinimicrobium pekingense TaxID=384677 RepID=A0ABQ2F9U9_9MICO|nr:D-hexose-6-phosphate mutarotase [Ornithinimicrobium pekingense]GGK75852.1 D-hexose-6-phosphate mutarotase [Ornithinimicrobium pekingense]